MKSIGTCIEFSEFRSEHLVHARDFEDRECRLIVAASSGDQIADLDVTAGAQGLRL